MMNVTVFAAQIHVSFSNQTHEKGNIGLASLKVSTFVYKTKLTLDVQPFFPELQLLNCSFQHM